MSDLVDLLRKRLAEPEPEFVHPGMIAYGDVEILLWGDTWKCRVCGAGGWNISTPELPNPPWEHMGEHVAGNWKAAPRTPRRHWWRR